MENAALSHAPEQLLGQADFVRALARSLLADASTAEDVAQDALVAGLEQPPASPGALRGWLARVVRTLVLQRGRSEARRAGREASAARAEGLPSTAEVLERESARAAVVRAVLALEEPYRSTILLRFYEAHAPREIAVRLGVPVETVHTRTKRALALLRARLDREFGSRAAWAALLVPFTRSSPPPAGKSAPPSSASSADSRRVSMHPALELAGLGLALVAGAAYWLSSESRASARPTSTAVGRDTERAPASPDRSTAAERAGAQRTALTPVQASAPAAAAAVVAPPAPTPSAFSTTTLHLTLTWSDATPAAGVQLRVMDVGRTSFEPLEGTTDAAGECTVAGLRAGRVWITVDRREIWIPAEVAAGDSEFALQLERGFDIEGRVVDANGDAVPGATVWLGQLAGSPELNFALTTAAADGSFSIRSCEPRKSIWARAAGHAPSLQRVLDEDDEAEGSTMSITLALGGAGGTVTGQVLDPEGAPIEGALVLVDGQDMLHGVWPDGPGGEKIIACHTGPTSTRTDASGNFTVAGVRPGNVPLAVLVPGLAPWRGSVSIVVGATASVAVTLSPGFRLSGTVRDAGGNPAAGRVWVMLSCYEISPTHMVGPDGVFEFDGLTPGTVRVFADSRDDVEAWTTLTGQAGDELTWDALLGPDDGELVFETEPWR